METSRRDDHKGRALTAGSWNPWRVVRLLLENTNNRGRLRLLMAPRHGAVAAAEAARPTWGDPDEGRWGLLAVQDEEEGEGREAGRSSQRCGQRSETRTLQRL